MADFEYPGTATYPGGGAYPGVYTLSSGGPPVVAGIFDATSPNLRTFSSAPQLATFDQPEPLQ